MTSDNSRKYDVTFSLLTAREYGLVVNAIKRQVDYFRNKVFNEPDTLNDIALSNYKINYKIYSDLYNKIIRDYNDVVKLNA